MATLKLSKKGYEILEKAMVELQINERPHALRLAFAKGIVEGEDIEDEKSKDPYWEFQPSVVAKGDEVLLFKHLLIEKLGRSITDHEFYRLMLNCIEAGLRIMEKEMKGLSDLDNYLLFLVDKHSRLLHKEVPT